MGAKRVTTKEFINRAKSVHGDYYDYSKVVYSRNDKKIEIICPIHGSFWQRPRTHIKNLSQMSGSGCYICNKFTSQDDFVKRSGAIHGNKYDYSRVAYTDGVTKISIFCPSHGEFFQIPNVHLRGAGCPACGTEKRLLSKHSLFAAEFVNKAKSAHGCYYDYSKVVYKTTTIKVEILCPIHGNFLQTPNGHLNGAGCGQCGITTMALARSTKKDIFTAKAGKIHNNKFIYDRVPAVFTGNDYIEIGCPDHGYFKQKLQKHLAGHDCKKCVADGLRFTQEEFLAKAIAMHGNKYDYTKVTYLGCNDSIIIICPDHGEFSQRPVKHLIGRGCEKCSNCYSKIENLWLDSLFVPENCRQAWIRRDGFRCKVDALVIEEDKNSVYEFYGDFWHGNPEIYNLEDINPRTKCSFGELYQKTIQRKKKLEDLGFSVIYIWENDYVLNLMTKKAAL